MLIQLLPFWILFGTLSAYFAHKRGRSAKLWFLVGLLGGLLGFLTLFFLPIIKKEKPKETIIVPPRLDSQFDRPWFYVDINHQKQGPLFFTDLWKAWQSGHFNEHCLIWCEGMENWKKVQDITELLKELSIKNS